MAEPEELDEDLFADLYDNDNAAPQEHTGENAHIDTAAPAPAATEDNYDAGMSGYNHDSSMGQAPGQAFSPQATNAGDVSSVPDPNGFAPHEHSQAAPEPEHSGIAIKEDGKMFIGGLNWETTDESLRRHFEEFGEVAECTVMRDAATGRSRGFGFLTFKDPKTVNTVMVKEHYLDGKIIDPKRAIPRDEQERTSKIFVGGVSQEATDEDFKNYFMQYGRVIDATLMMDKDTKRPRGFGFVTFDSEAAVEATLRGDLVILGKPIEVKRAQPRGNVQQEEEQMRRGPGRRGREMGGEQQQGTQNNPMFQNGMTPQMMAQYFQRMQQYFAQMMANMGGGMGMMNPAMMQQMKQLQQMQAMQQGNQGANGGQNMQMNAQMMQQMQQMQAMQQAQQMQMGGGAGGGGNSPASGTGSSGQANMNGVPTGPANPGGAGRRPNSNTPDQAMYDQGRRAGNQNMGYQQGGPTSWEGMYDDVPQPEGAAGGNMGGGNMGGGNMGGGGHMGQGGHRGRRGGGFQAPRGPSAAPANAPTGPRNAGVPGANYRGGRGNHHRGFHPYGRR